MISGMLLSWALLLLSITPLLAHPVSDPADMPYTGPDSMEETGAEELSVSDVSSLLQRAAALGYSPLLSREGLKLNGLLPKEASKMVVLENPGHLTSLGHLLGIKRPYRKRANGADCFWKYCV